MVAPGREGTAPYCYRGTFGRSEERMAVGPLPLEPPIADKYLFGQ